MSIEFVKELPLSAFAAANKDGYEGIRTDLYRCSRHGEFKASTYLSFGERSKPICPACAAEEAEESRSKEMAEFNAGMFRVRAGIPPEHSGVTWDALTPRDDAEREAVTQCKAIACGWANSLVLVGKTGVGKSWWMAALANDCIQSGISVLIVKESDVMSRLRDSFSSRGENETDIINELSRPRVLALEDVGVTERQDYKRAFMQSLIDRRHGDGKRTVLVSNNTPEQFRSYLGDPVISRLQQRGKILVLTGTDRRRK